MSVDLEVDPRRAKVFDLAAVRHNEPTAIRLRNGDLNAALDELEASLGAVNHLLGHNILRHDLPHLAVSRPRLTQMIKAPIDTLWLNPLAFPRNPYHHLVKHYQDGRLQAGHINDPELDARLVFGVLENQIAAFSQLNAEQPDALLWISVAGAESVMPPWVRAQFREAALILRHLRDTACDSPDCAWCREKNDPVRALSRWFGFDAFPLHLSETCQALRDQGHAGAALKQRSRSHRRGGGDQSGRAAGGGSSCLDPDPGRAR